MARDQGHVAGTEVNDERVPGPTGDLDHLRRVDVAVVGSGPWAFLVCSELAERINPDQIVVLDPSPWFSTCIEMIERLEVGRVDGRSVLGDALRVVTRSAAHQTTVDARAALTRCVRRVAELGLDRSWRPGRVGWLVPTVDSASTLVRLTDGRQIWASHVVLAPGAQRRNIPHWVEDLVPQPFDRLVHADDLDLRPLDLTGQRIAVVGTATMALHLAARALHRGAARVEVLTSAPEGANDHLLTSRTEDRLRIRLGARVIAAQRRNGHSELVLGDERRVGVDRVWLATGTRTDVLADRTLRFVRNRYPARATTPRPLDDGYRWPGTAIYAVGPTCSLRTDAGGEDRRGRIAAATGVAQAIARSLGTCGPTRS